MNKKLKNLYNFTFIVCAIAFVLLTFLPYMQSNYKVDSKYLLVETYETTEETTEQTTAETTEVTTEQTIEATTETIIETTKNTKKDKIKENAKSTQEQTTNHAKKNTTETKKGSNENTKLVEESDDTDNLIKEYNYYKAVWISKNDGKNYSLGIYEDNGEYRIAKNEFVKLIKKTDEAVIDATYYFGNDTFMYTGWLNYKNGNKYYFIEESNNDQGAMCFGYRIIDNKKYYFDIDGKLVMNGKTHDGLLTNEKGEIIEK